MPIRLPKNDLQTFYILHVHLGQYKS